MHICYVHVLLKAQLKALFVQYIASIYSYSDPLCDICTKISNTLCSSFIEGDIVSYVYPYLYDQIFYRNPSGHNAKIYF